MYIFAIVLSSLALLAALACLSLVVYERKRSKERSAALMQYADSVKASVDITLTALSGKVKDLEGGVVPDYEKAKAAADAVNNFNAGISGILGFDPHDVLKKQRAEGGD